MVSEEEERGVKSVLTAAALTYVAAAVTAIVLSAESVAHAATAMILTANKEI